MLIFVSLYLKVIYYNTGVVDETQIAVEVRGRGMTTVSLAMLSIAAQTGIAIYRKERSFRGRKVPSAEGRFFVRKEAFK